MIAKSLRAAADSVKAITSTPRGATSLSRRAWQAAFCAAFSGALLSFAVHAQTSRLSRYDYAGQLPAEDLSGNLILWILLPVAAAGVWLLRGAEATGLGEALASRLAVLQVRLAPFRDRAVRYACVVFCIAYAFAEKVILAPELVTQATGVYALHLVAALSLFIRRGEPVAGVALLLLFLLGWHEYGAIRMLDHLLPLGVAVYFLLWPWRTQHPIRALRIVTAASFMWLSVERCAFPNWVLQVAQEQPAITLGLPPQHFITLTGVVEFALGFGLLWRGLYAELSALALMLSLTIAEIERNYADLPGAILTLAVLAALALDRAPATSRTSPSPPWSVAASFLGTSVALIAVYHAAFVLQSRTPTAQLEVAVSDVWIPALQPQQQDTGVFMRITATEAARLVEARSPAATTVELHAMSMANNVVQMWAVSGIDLPAGAVVEFKPGGFHVMLNGLRRTLRVGDTVPITLVLEGEDRKRRTVAVNASVRPLEAGESTTPER